MQALLLDVLTCADVQQTVDSAHFFVFEEAMRCGCLALLQCLSAHGAWSTVTP